MRYRILGPLEVEPDGTTANLGAGRHRALLALLLLHRNEVVSSDRIVDELWGDRAPATAQKVVQGYVSQLRKTIGDADLVTRPPGYVLHVAHGEVDTDRFEELLERAQSEDPIDAAKTLRAALALWRGPPLSEFAYDSFAQGEISRLEELRLAAIEDRIDAELALGRPARLVPELEALVHEHPLRERLRGQQMLALYRAGRQPEALEAYADARRRLVEELGLEPSSELRDLQRRILAHDPALGGGTRPPLEVVAAHARAFIAVGAVLLAAALAAAAFVLTRGSSGVTVRANEVAVIDPATDRVVDTVGVGQTPTRIASGAGAIWVLNGDDRTITRIDPRSRDVRTVSPGATLTDLAVGADAVWAANGDDGTVTRIDAASTRIERVIRMPDSGSAGFVAAGAAAVWVSSGPQRRPTEWRIDPHSNRVSTTVRFRYGTGGLAVAVADGSVWIRGEDGVARLDSASGAVLDSIDLPTNPYVAEYSPGIAANPTGVWVTSSASGTAWHIDPATGRPLASIAIQGDPRGVAIGEGSVWITDAAGGSLLRVDPETNRVVATIRLGEHPSGVTVGNGRVWVSVD